METTANNYPVGDLRVSDADRDGAVSELSEAFQAGRITHEEFEQRSGKALRARTGNELSALFTDLLTEGGNAAVAAPGRCLVIAARAVVAASAVATVSLGALALSTGLSGAPAPLTLAQREARREIAQQVLAHQGISVTVPLPPAVAASGFDWVGTVTPAAIAILLIALIVVVLRASRA
jgi:hypothetical protein